MKKKATKNIFYKNTTSNDLISEKEYNNIHEIERNNRVKVHIHDYREW